MRDAMCRAITLACATLAFQPIATQPAVPLRQFSSPFASTVEPLDRILGIKEIDKGRVLVNDAGRRRLLSFDSSLKSFTVVADTTGGSAGYGRFPAQLIPYLGDSSLFVDNATQALLLVDGAARIVHTTALPRQADFVFVNGSRVGVDPQGRLIYRGASPRRPNGVPGAGETVLLQESDSAPIVRANFETRAIDTLARVRIHTPQSLYMTREASGRLTSRAVVNPLTAVDDWDILADGTLAIVRGNDYHVEFLNANGTFVACPKMPYVWLRLSDPEKQQLADSALNDQMKKLHRTTAIPDAAGRVVGRAIGGTITGNRTDGSVSTTPSDAALVTAPLQSIPDYYPPIRAGAVAADLDNNLWILPTTAARGKNGELIYDRVNRKGVLFDRVVAPPGRSLAGFGRGGTAYLMWRDSTQVWHLEKRTLRP